MRLEIKGKIAPFDMEGTLEDALELWATKIREDNPEMAAAFTEIEDVYFTKVTVDIGFKVKGIDDLQVITTDNHEGIPELLVVAAETDADGNLLRDSLKDNDENSLFTEAEALIASGLSSSRKEIVSDYLDTEFHAVTTVVVDSSTVVEVFKTAEETVVQVYDTSSLFKLFAEVAFPLEEYDKLVEHYQQLAEVVAE